MNLYDILDSISSIGSTLAKQDIMEANKHDDRLKMAFMLAEDSRYNFYIRWNEEDLVCNSVGRDIILLDLEIFHRLNAREITGNAARDAFTAALEPLNSGARLVMMRILNRDLRCNAGTSISNKVWPKLIREQPCMLAGKFDNKAIASIVPKKNGYICQQKMDGGRVMAEVNLDGGVTCKSRGGNTLLMHDVLHGILGKFPGFVFDGELLVKGPDGLEDRKTGNGYFTKAVRGTITFKEASRFHYVIWDVIPIDEFNAGKGTLPYKTRLEMVQKFSEKMDPRVVSVVETKTVSTLEEIQEFYGEMIALGHEGAIIKFSDAPWEDKRSKNMIKMKLVNTADLQIVAIQEGQGKFRGKLGNLICATSDELLVVSVGSGFKDIQREGSWDDLEARYIGKIVEIEYNEIIESRDRDTKCLFLPIFKQIRIDKYVANKLSELV